MSFFRRNKEKIVVLFVVIGLIVIISSTKSGRKSLSRIENSLGNMLTPGMKGLSRVSNSFSNGFKDFKNVFSLREENEDLKKEIAVLREKNREYENIIGQTEYLKEQYQLEKTTNYKLKPATVIAKEPGNFFDRFTIDKGSKDGVKKGDILVQAVAVEQNHVIEGLVGRVVDVGDNWSKVITIVDENSRISFKVLRSQDGGIVQGDVNSKLTGFLFDDKADIVKGDKLYTSGLGGIFKKNLYIGDVEEVINDDEDMIKNIKITPAIDFKKIYNLYILSED